MKVIHFSKKYVPQVLILSLKRFVDSTSTKINTVVDFPIEALDLLPYLSHLDNTNESTIYDLFSVCNHIGNTVRNDH